MKLAILIGVAILVLVTLSTSFPVVMVAQNRTDDRLTNTDDHMAFTRELAQQGSRLDALAEQHKAMMGVPERMARLEERLDILVQMVYALLAGVFGLLLKELWNAILATRGRQKEFPPSVILG